MSLVERMAAVLRVIDYASFGYEVGTYAGSPDECYMLDAQQVLQALREAPAEELLDVLSPGHDYGTARALVRRLATGWRVNLVESNPLRSWWWRNEDDDPPTQNMTAAEVALYGEWTSG